MFSIQVGWNINMIKRLHKNVKKLLNFQIWESKFWNCTWKVKQNIKNAEIIQCFFRPTKKANYSNEISTVHMPNSPQIQTNKTKETQQLTWSFVSKSLPSKKAEILSIQKSIVSNWSANSIDGMSLLFQ